MQDKVLNNETSDNSASAIADLKASFNQSPQTGSLTSAPALQQASVPVHRPPQNNIRRLNVDHSNPIYTQLQDTKLTSFEKQNAIAQALTFSRDHDASKEYLKEFKQFNQLLQQEHKQVAQKITAISDMEIFSELNSVYDETFTGLISFEAKVKELTDIVDAIYTLRMKGITYDVLREIAKDKEADFKLASQRAEQEQTYKSLKHAIKDKTRQIALLEQDLTLFGFGVVTRASRGKIALLKIDILEHNEELASLAEQMSQTPKEAVKQSNFAEYAAQKAKLRELLDLSPLQHKERHKEVVSAAQDFIRNCEERINRVTEHIETMNRHINSLGEANLTMREYYAIVNEATKIAEKQNKSLYLTLQTGESLESDSERSEREHRKHELELHLSALADSTRHSNAVVAELIQLGDRIQSMQAANEAQMERTRQLHNSSKLGIAGLAGQLTSVIQAVSTAALGEASDLARISLEQMQQVTVSVREKEGVRQAFLAQTSKDTSIDFSYELALKEQSEKVELDDSLLGSTEGLLGRSDLLTKEY